MAQKLHINLGKAIQEVFTENNLFGYYFTIITLQSKDSYISINEVVVVFLLDEPPEPYQSLLVEVVGPGLLENDVGQRT